MATAHPDTVHDLPPGSTGNGARVSISGLGVAFGGNRVIEDLDLDIDGGQFIAIVGRSGCGKSTLLRTIIGLENPDRGAIEVDRSRARFVFQEPRLLPWNDVLANVATGADGPAAERRARAAEALELVGLFDKRGDWPATLSGGQRQRVALARALVSRPCLLLLDEPLGALAALTRIEMQRLLERVWMQQRFTAVLVTHDVAEAVTLGDRVVLMKYGRITQDIPVAAHRPRPHGSASLAEIEAYVLDHVLSESMPPVET